MTFPDHHRAPNIADHPDVYVWENEAVDLDGSLWRALRACCDWSGRTLLDLGCGTGFWLPRYAPDAARVVGVEPDPDLPARAGERGRDAAELETVLRIEFPADVVDAWVRANPGRRELTYGYVLFLVTA